MGPAGSWASPQPAGPRRGGGGAAPEEARPWDPPLVSSATPPGTSDERVRLALRVVVYLDRLGPPNNGGTAAPESTQQGLASALSTTQGAVSKVLSRLVAASVVHQERCHVRGRDRRVRIYYLTASGTELAREIEERFGLPAPAWPPGKP
ncbi:MAG TPA: hypothetical protein VEH57_02380 [Thermoplasmata archaeon]|nr:hypothetical protein [Thermoplasmata archaeon]